MTLKSKGAFTLRGGIKQRNRNGSDLSSKISAAQHRTAPYGALLLSLCTFTTTSIMIQRRAAPCGAVRRRWSADRSCFAAPYGAQCECHLRHSESESRCQDCCMRLPIAPRALDILKDSALRTLVMMCYIKLRFTYLFITYRGQRGPKGRKSRLK